MCIHRRSFLHSLLHNSCLNRQQRRIKATTVNRTASWSWTQTAQATRQVLLRLQVKQTHLSGNASSEWEIIANNTAAAAPIYITSSSESEEQDSEFSRLPLLSDSASSDSEIMPSTAAGAPIYVSSSSESDDQDSAALVPGRNLTPSDFKSYRQA